MKLRTKFGLGQRVYIFVEGQVKTAIIRGVRKSVNLNEVLHQVSETIYTLYSFATPSKTRVKLGDYLEEDIFETEAEADRGQIGASTINAMLKELKFQEAEFIKIMDRLSKQPDYYILEDCKGINGYDARLLKIRGKIEALEWALGLN